MDKDQVVAFARQRFEAFRDRPSMWGGDEAREMCSIQLLEFVKLFNFKPGRYSRNTFVSETFNQASQRFKTGPLRLSAIPLPNFSQALYEVSLEVLEELLKPTESAQ